MNLLRSVNINNKFISNTRKLDFRDVLIVPRKTTIKSRKEVDIRREFTFKNNTTWKGVPIISANMDTVSDINTFDTLRCYDYITCFPKHMNVQWFNCIQTQIPKQLALVDNYMLTCGTGKIDKNNIIALMKRLERIDICPRFLCVDVANGYMQQLQDTCASVTY
jgi:GMP reductase